MGIVYFILIYFIISTAFTSVLLYKTYKNDIELDGLHWSAYIISGVIYGWITTPMYLFVRIMEYVGIRLGKAIDKTLTKFLKNK